MSNIFLITSSNKKYYRWNKKFWELYKPFWTEKGFRYQQKITPKTERGVIALRKKELQIFSIIIL